MTSRFKPGRAALPIIPDTVVPLKANIDILEIFEVLCTKFESLPPANFIKEYKYLNEEAADREMIFMAPLCK